MTFPLRKLVRSYYCRIASWMTLFVAAFLLLHRLVRTTPDRPPGLQPDVVIPSKVWQTGKSSALPEALYNSTSSWRRLNPDFEVQFHDDAAVQEVIALNFNKEILEMFSAFPVPVMKVSSLNFITLASFKRVQLMGLTRSNCPTG